MTSEGACRKLHGEYFGWSDPGGRVQLALFSAYIFGIICGYRVNS